MGQAPKARPPESDGAPISLLSQTRGLGRRTWAEGAPLRPPPHLPTARPGTRPGGADGLWPAPADVAGAELGQTDLATSVQLIVLRSPRWAVACTSGSSRAELGQTDLATSVQLIVIRSPRWAVACTSGRSRAELGQTDLATSVQLIVVGSRWSMGYLFDRAEVSREVQRSWRSRNWGGRSGPPPGRSRQQPCWQGDRLPHFR